MGATGATVINQYVVVKTLGRGSFGKVKLCLNTIDGQMYAVKVGGRGTCRLKQEQDMLCNNGRVQHSAVPWL
jgi:[calcium/calmodulin-dependent protein kinase] kinase